MKPITNHYLKHYLTNWAHVARNISHPCDNDTGIARDLDDLLTKATYKINCDWKADLLKVKVKISRFIRKCNQENLQLSIPSKGLYQQMAQEIKRISNKDFTKVCEVTF